MANIINNSLMVFGSKSNLNKLKDFLEDKQETIKVLSQDIFGIYKPENTRYLENNDFGLFPDSFSNKVNVWDIGFWKKEIMSYDFDKNESQGFIDIIYCWSDEIKEADECLIFAFQSKYSEPDIGFKKLSALFSKLSFYWYSYGEYEDIFKKELHFKNGKQLFEDSE